MLVVIGGEWGGGAHHWSTLPEYRSLLALFLCESSPPDPGYQTEWLSEDCAGASHLLLHIYSEPAALTLREDPSFSIPLENESVCEAV